VGLAYQLPLLPQKHQEIGRVLTEALIGTETACRGVTAVLGGKAVRCSAGRTTAGALRASDLFGPVRGFLGNVEGGSGGCEAHRRRSIARSGWRLTGHRAVKKRGSAGAAAARARVLQRVRVQGVRGEAK
jgi:hypothetical protein